MSDAESNERAVRRFLDRVLTGLSPDQAEDLVSADAVIHDRLPGQPEGREGIQWLSQRIGQAFGYLDVDVGEVIVAEGRIIARWTARSGQRRDRAPGATTISGIDIFRVADGMIVERHSQSNLASVLEEVEAGAGGMPAVAGDAAGAASPSGSASAPAGSAADPASSFGARNGTRTSEDAPATPNADQGEVLSPIDQDRKALRENPDLAQGLALNQNYRYCFIKSLVDPNLLRPVIYTPRPSLVDDRVFALAEADIILGEVQELTAIASDIISSDPAHENGGTTKGVAITGDRYRWPAGRVAYVIDPNLPSPTRVTSAINHWQQRTGGLIQFVQRTNEMDYVTFRRGQGCASSVGRIGGQQFIELALTCTTGNVIHEIGHAIGLWHEQSREDRDRFIKVMWANIMPDMMHNFFQHITDGDDIGAYDYASIMHYNATAFTRNGAATIVTPHGEAIGQRLSLSDGDVAAVRALYAGQPAPVSANNGWWDALAQALRGAMDESEVRSVVGGGERAGAYAGSLAGAQDTATARKNATEVLFR